MLIDIILVIAFVMALVKGVRNGLIVGLFSLVAFVVGLAAAIKLSATVAGWMSAETEVSGRWIPFLSFLIVFIVVVVLINIGARLLRKAVELVMLGFVDKIGGVLLYFFLYLVILSVLFFFAEKLHIIGEETMENSVAYSYIRPLGPVVVGSLGKLLPFFADSFRELEKFFESVNERIPPPSETVGSWHAYFSRSRITS